MRGRRAFLPRCLKRARGSCLARCSGTLRLHSDAAEHNEANTRWNSTGTYTTSQFHLD